MARRPRSSAAIPQRVMRKDGMILRRGGRAARESCEPDCCGGGGRCDGSEIPGDPQQGLRCCSDEIPCGIPDRLMLLTAQINAHTSTAVETCGFGGGSQQKDWSFIDSSGSLTFVEDQLPGCSGFSALRGTISTTDDNGFCSRFGGECLETRLTCHPADLSIQTPRRLEYRLPTGTFTRTFLSTFDCDHPFVVCSPGIEETIEDVQTFRGAIALHAREGTVSGGLRRFGSTCDADSFHVALLSFEVYYRPATGETFWSVRLDPGRPFELEHINPTMSASVELVIHGCLSGAIIRAQASSQYELRGEVASSQVSVCLDLSTNVSSCAGGLSRGPSLSGTARAPSALDELRSRGLVRV